MKKLIFSIILLFIFSLSARNCVNFGVSFGCQPCNAWPGPFCTYYGWYPGNSYYYYNWPASYGYDGYYDAYRACVKRCIVKCMKEKNLSMRECRRLCRKKCAYSCCED